GTPSTPITSAGRGKNGRQDAMKLSRATSYAIHAVVFMATQKHDHPIASHHIAEAQSIPERFLLKVLKPLVSVRVLHSVKGPNGGYRLAKMPREISLLEVVEAVDGSLRGQASFTRDQTDSRLNRRLDMICDKATEQTRKL